MAGESAPSSWRAALTLGVVGLVGLGGLLGLRALTAERVAEQERAATRRALAVLLPAAFDNDPDADRIAVEAPAWLGGSDALPVRRARHGGRVTALLVEAIAPDGYNGDIRLLVGIARDGRVIGVRVLDHRETPGLGDAIESARSAWIDGFRGRALGDPARDAWRVRRDGGEFDQLAGATITPRAVVGAVRRALEFAARHGDALASAEAGRTIGFHDGPEPLPEAPR